MVNSGRALFKSAHAPDTCFPRRARPSPRLPGDHPVRPSFMKSQISDSTSYSRHFTDHRQAAFRQHPCQGGVPGARRLPRYVFSVPGWLHPSRTPVLIDRSADGYRTQQHSLCLGRAAGSLVPPQGGKPEGLLNGVFGRVPIPGVAHRADLKTTTASSPNSRSTSAATSGGMRRVTSRRPRVLMASLVRGRTDPDTPRRPPRPRRGLSRFRPARAGSQQQRSSGAASTPRRRPQRTGTFPQDHSDPDGCSVRGRVRPALRGVRGSECGRTATRDVRRPGRCP